MVIYVRNLEPKPSHHLPPMWGGADERDAPHDVRADERDAGYCRVPARVTAAPGVGTPH